MGTKTLTEINTMWKAAWRGCRAAALLGIALALTPSPAHAQATRITSASGLAAGDTTLPYTITDNTFVPSYSGSAGGDTLTFTDAGQSVYEAQQGASYSGAFADGTNLLATINGSGGPAGPLTITFASGVTEFGMDAQNAWFGFEAFTFVPYSGTTPLGTYTVLAHDTGPAGLAFLGARAASGSITSVQISSTSSVSGKGNIFVVGPITYATTAPSTTLTSSRNPSGPDQSVTFTAAVTNPGSPTPTGTVQFAIDGANVGGPVPLDGSGQATDTETGLTLGTHAVSVTYAPTGAFTGNTVATLTQQVVTHLSPQYVSPSGNDGSDGSQGSPKLTLQAAINAALSGDTIIVEDGTYAGAGDVDLDFGGRNLTVTSQDGPATTIIDCGGSSSAIHRGFFFHSGETNAVVSGLTVQNGYEASGYEASGNGGDVDIENGSTATISHCIFSKSQAYRGGGVYNGGILTLTDCTFTGNSASDAGGGLRNENAATVTGCTFTGNTSTYGGGVYNLVNSTLALTNCILTANSVSSLGGGMDNGGAATLTNCTFTGNDAGSLGGGLNAGLPATLVNCIFWGDICLRQPEINGGVTAMYCDVQGGYAGTGNVDADPLFVSRSAPYDLHLRPGSPCLGAGTSSGTPATDITGATRPNPPSIGAYELPALAPPVTHLLWSNPDGRAAFWNVGRDGTPTVAGGYGPYTDSSGGLWHATALATGPDGVSHLLWNSASGQVALWNVTDGGAATVLAGYGPYTDGAGGSLWRAAGISVGPDNVTHLLWTNPDHRAAFWDVNGSGSGGFSVLAVYGPFTDGSPQNVWDAAGVSTGPDNVSHLLWSNANGRAAFWNVSDTDGSASGLAGYGPYTDGAAQNLWGAVGVSTGPDNVSHLLWDNTDGSVVFWDVSSASGMASGVAGYGPYTDGADQDKWRATGLATGPDDVSHLLWNNPDGRVALWSLDGAGSPSSEFGFGPYTDGTASNLWGAVGVSAGP